MRNILIFSTFVCFIFPIRGHCSYPLYLENEVHLALVSRDAYYHKRGVSEFLFPYNTLNLDSISAKMNALVSDTSTDSIRPWSDLLNGLVMSRSSLKLMNEYFEKAVNTASSNPGFVWVLTMEFGRFGQPYWERRCLELLEKCILFEGATLSAVVTQPLLYKALLAQRDGKPSLANDYYLLSQKFDRHLALPIVRQIISAFPFRVATMYEESEKLIVFLSHSWKAQLSLALNGILWLRTCVAFLVIAAFLTLGIKYAPIILHWVTELFPSSISRKSRNYFAFIIFFSCLSLGILPFLWLLTFLIWKYCTRRDKWIIGVGCLLLIVHPFSVRFEDMLRQCLMPEGSVTLFRKAIDEGYYSSLDRTVRTAAQERKDDFLAQTAAAIVALKGYDLLSAQKFIEKAKTIKDNDPVVLLTDGIVLYLSGQFEKATKVYEACYKLFPTFVAAFFNCGQCYLVSNETIKGMEYLDRATKLNSADVNTFISVNDEMFSKNWPRLRQFILSDYSSGYFWINIFPHYSGSWGTSNILWGPSFLGVPLWCYCIFAPLLFIVLLLLDFFIWSNVGVMKIFLCKLCGSPMCRRCKKGVICEHCFSQLHQIRNENIRQRIIERILSKNHKIKRIGASLLDVLFPGCGMLYQSTGIPVAALLYMIIAASSYAAIVVFHSIPTVYPFGTIKDLIMIMSLTLPLYNVVFVVRAVLKIFKEFRS